MRSTPSILVSYSLLAGSIAIVACSGAPGGLPSDEATGVESNALAVAAGGDVASTGSKRTPVARVNSLSSVTSSPGILDYFGGPVVANAKVVQVNWNASVDPTIKNGMPGFYTAITHSELFEWLDGDYATTRKANAGSHNGQAGTNQHIGFGTFASSVTLSQASTTVTDANIQTTLATAFNNHTLPAPDANTIYMIQFPPHSSITTPDGGLSCVTFCAYHSTMMYGTLAVKYGVLPDVSVDCNFGCGGDPSYFNNGTSAASHELIETVTDANVGVVPNIFQTGTYDYPAAWASQTNGEIGDICNQQETTIAAAQPGGSHYVVQAEYDNAGGNCIVAKPAGPPSGANVAAIQEGSGTMDAVFVAQDGSVQLTSDTGSQSWANKINLSRPGFAPPGAPVAAAVQNTSQIDVFVVGNDGAVYAMYEGNGGPWNGPIPISATGLLAPGAHIATARHPGANQLDVFYVNKNGAVEVQWVVGFGAFAGPLAITGNSAAPGGAPLAAGLQNANQLDVVWVGPNGAIEADAVAGTGAWFGPVALSGASLAPAGAPIATATQGPQFDVFTTDALGNVEAMWVAANNVWLGPLALTSGGIAGKGANIATGNQNANQLDIFYTDVTGRLDAQFVIGQGAWSGPIALSSTGLAPAGAPVAAALQNANQLDAFVSGPSGLNSVYEINNGVWHSPTVIYPH